VPAKVKSSHIIEEHVVVGVPAQVAYDQWSQYDKFGEMLKKESADEKERDQIEFTSKIGPSKRTWTAEIVEQAPGRRIVWRSTSGPQTMGAVSFHALDDRLTQIMVEMEYHPSGMFETVGNFFRMQRRRVRKDLKLFKNYVELRGEATGHRRGSIDHGGLTDEVDARSDQQESSQDDDERSEEKQS
jgi:uncharacterized membrane protein